LINSKSKTPKGRREKCMFELLNSILESGIAIVASIKLLLLHPYVQLALVAFVLKAIVRKFD